MAVRISPVRFGDSRKPARISLKMPFKMSFSLGAAALMLAATAQPGVATTADMFSARTASPPIASAVTALADARPATAAPSRAKPTTRAANPAVHAQRAQRPRIVRTASMAPRLRRSPPVVAATPYRTDCWWFSCGHQVSWLFLGIGF
jgi:hypothetical protein